MRIQLGISVLNWAGTTVQVPLALKCIYQEPSCNILPCSWLVSPNLRAPLPAASSKARPYLRHLFGHRNFHPPPPFKTRGHHTISLTDGFSRIWPHLLKKSVNQFSQLGSASQGKQLLSPSTCKDTGAIIGGFSSREIHITNAQNLKMYWPQIRSPNCREGVKRRNGYTSTPHESVTNVCCNSFNSLRVLKSIVWRWDYSPGICAAQVELIHTTLSFALGLFRSNNHRILGVYLTRIHDVQRSVTECFIGKMKSIGMWCYGVGTGKVHTKVTFGPNAQTYIHTHTKTHTHTRTHTNSPKSKTFVTKRPETFEKRIHASIPLSTIQQEMFFKDVISLLFIFHSRVSGLNFVLQHYLSSFQQNSACEMCLNETLEFHQCASCKSHCGFSTPDTKTFWPIFPKAFLILEFYRVWGCLEEPHTSMEA